MTTSLMILLTGKNMTTINIESIDTCNSIDIPIWKEHRSALEPLIETAMADPAILNAMRAAHNLEREGREADAAIVSDWLLAQPSY